MKIHQTDTMVISNGKERSSMSMVSNAQAFRVLSDSLYEHKIASIVRELSSNANDSHLAAGKKDTPFRYHLPNSLTSTFGVEDFGVGLDDEGVRTVMYSYFQSTKDNSNLETGCLGLGSKSPLAYTDAFFITARKDGVERVYTSYWGEGGIPELNMVHQTPTTECDGVKIELPVQEGDRREFIRCASFMANLFSVTPEFVGGVPNDGTMNLMKDFSAKVEQGGMFDFNARSDAIPVLYRGSSMWVVMGSVIYPTVVDDIMESLDKSTRAIVHNRLGGRNTIVVPVGMGEVDFSASREKLSLTPRTMERVAQAVEAFAKETISQTQELVDPEISPIGNAFRVAKFICASTGHQLSSTVPTAWMKKTFIPTDDGEKTVHAILYDKIGHTHNELLGRLGMTRFTPVRRGTWRDGAWVMTSDEMGSYIDHRLSGLVDEDGEPVRKKVRTASRELTPAGLFSSASIGSIRVGPLADKLFDVNKKIAVFYASGATTNHRKYIRSHVMGVNGDGPLHMAALFISRPNLSSRVIELIKSFFGEEQFEFYDVSVIHAEEKELRRKKREHVVSLTGGKGESSSDTVRGSNTKVRGNIAEFNMVFSSRTVGIGNFSTSTVIDTAEETVFYIDPENPMIKGSNIADTMAVYRYNGAKSLDAVRTKLMGSIRKTFDITPNALRKDPSLKFSGKLIMVNNTNRKRIIGSNAIDITGLLATRESEEQVMSLKGMKGPSYIPSAKDILGAHAPKHRSIGDEALVTLMNCIRDRITDCIWELANVKFISENESIPWYRRDGVKSPEFHNVHLHYEDGIDDAEWHNRLASMIFERYPMAYEIILSGSEIGEETIKDYVEMVDAYERMSDNESNKGE
ncbi:MAG: hypothetical protein CMF22_11665 [Idiomarinaceae bacterium]|nr:hypothetical protein [Idiomarinaceae bacterium]|tara:strand:- start:60398 stop:62971 length:2574 start_codon:yes stop_codon:yes gene_type:complete